MPSELLAAAPIKRASPNVALVLPSVAFVWIAAWFSPASGDSTSAHQRSQLLRGCGSCHSGHGRPQTKMLPAAGQALCFRCHSTQAARISLQEKQMLAATVALRDVSLDFRLPYTHPVDRARGVHRANEVLPEREGQKPRHVDCVDCHSAHRTKRLGARVGGQRVPRRSSLDGFSPEYTLCYRCHSDSANLPRTATNTRLAFSPRNRSYHPVEAVGRNGYVPSLRSPLSASSRISCGDCHGNSSGKGMHGSRYQFLLRENYSTINGAAESSQTYALCYRCHDRQILFSGKGFSQHAKHVKTGRIPCVACHSAHGSPTTPYLLVFSRTFSRPDETTGRIAYVSTGRGSGKCYVNCHGANHSGTEYCNASEVCNGTRQPASRKLQPVRQRMRNSPFSF